MDLAPALASITALQLLVHATSVFSVLLGFIFRPRFLLRTTPKSLLWFFLCSYFCPAQAFSSNQVPQNSFALVKSPIAGSRFYLGTNLPISIDIPEAMTTSFSAHLDALDIYLVNLQSNANISVATSLEILGRRAGSNVRHINYTIPLCTSPGQYNLTVYERAHINSRASFTVTLIPIVIGDATHPPPPSGQSPLPSNPPPRMLAVRATTTLDRSIQPPLPATVTLLDTILPSNTAAPGPGGTITLLSTTTFTTSTTVSGEVRPSTITDMATITTTVIATTNPTTTNFVGFVPVNAALSQRSTCAFSLWIVIGLLCCYLMLN